MYNVLCKCHTFREAWILRQRNTRVYLSGNTRVNLSCNTRVYISCPNSLCFASFEDRLFKTHHWRLKQQRYDKSNTIWHAHVTEEKIDLKWKGTLQANWDKRETIANGKSKSIPGGDACSPNADCQSKAKLEIQYHLTEKTTFMRKKGEITQLE